MVARFFLVSAAMVLTSGCHTLHSNQECAPCDESKEIHVKAPPQKIIVDLPAEESCPATSEDSSADAQGKPSSPAKAQGGPSTPQSSPTASPMASPMAAPMAMTPTQAASVAADLGQGFAAIPTIRPRTFLALDVDFIHIPIPIPRLLIQEGPPKVKMSYVQMNQASLMGASAYGASAYGATPMIAGGVAPMVAGGMAPAGVIQASALMPAGQSASASGLTTAQLEAVAKLLAEKTAASSASSAARAESSDEKAALAQKEKDIEAKAKKLDESCKKLEASLEKLEIQQKKQLPK